MYKVQCKVKCKEYIIHFRPDIVQKENNRKSNFKNEEKINTGVR